MDEKTIFYIALGLFFIYNSSQFKQFMNKNVLEYYLNQVFNLFNSDIFKEGLSIETLEKITEKPLIKYENKFLTEIRKLEKKFIFNEKEKEILEEKESNFLNNIQNNYKNKIEENKNRLCDIEISLSNLERSEYREKYFEEEYYFEEKYEKEYTKAEEYYYEENTKEEKIKILSREKTTLYIEIKKLNELLETETGKQELLNNAKEFALNFLVNLRLEKLLKCYVMETTPQGNVLMIYDNKKGSFRYYSDNSIPYRYLEVVARKYVKLFDCRPLYVDMEEELELSEIKWEKEKIQKEENKQKEEQKESNVPEKKNIFAKFKSYNKEGTNGRVNVGVPPKNSIPITKEQENEKILLKEKANRYTYEGKLINFSFLQKVERKMVDKKYSLSFADFKNIKNNQNKN